MNDVNLTVVIARRYDEAISCKSSIILEVLNIINYCSCHFKEVVAFATMTIIIREKEILTSVKIRVMIHSRFVIERRHDEAISCLVLNMIRLLRFARHDKKLRSP